jgi:WD40 repeat protein
MSRESDRSRASFREDRLAPSRVGIGSTRVALCNRRRLGLLVVLSAALIGFSDVRPSEEDARPRLVPGEPGLHTKSFAISADGTKMVTTDLDGSVGLRDARSGWRLERFPTLPHYVRSASLSPDGRFLVCAAAQSGVTLFDLQSRGEMRSLPVPLQHVHLVAYAPDGRTIAVVSEQDWRIILWDVAGERVSWSLPLSGRVVQLAFSADGRYLASVGLQHDASIIVWELATRRHRLVVNGRANMALALSRDGRLLASANQHDRVIRLWDLNSAARHRSLEGCPHFTMSIAFAPDGTTLATAGVDGMVRLWTLSTGRQKAVLDGDAQAICDVAFSPDGRWLAAMAKDDYHLRLWEFAEDGPVSHPSISQR